MKQILILLIIFLVSFANGQTPADSISATPNPFSQRTLVSYTMVTNDTISIRVYNISGAVIIVLVTDSIVSTGVHQDSLIMDNFPDGIYYLSLLNRRGILKTAKIVKSSTTAIHQLSTSNLNLTVYPNPSTGVYNVAFNADKSTNVGYQVYNLIGQEVKSGVYWSSVGKNTFEVNLGDLMDGAYTLTIFNSNDFVHKQKLIRN